MIYKLNGRVVTKKELDRHYAERNAIYGDPLEEMLADRCAPGVMTDDVFLSGVGTLEQQIPDKQQLEHIVKQARKHSYNPKPTDFYNEALAAFPGDPKAFLNHGQGRGHLKKTLEERGYKQDRDGDVKVVRGPEEDPYLNPEHKLHPKIINKIKQDRIKDNPDLARADQRRLEEEIVAAHGWNKER